MQQNTPGMSDYVSSASNTIHVSNSSVYSMKFPTQNDQDDTAEKKMKTIDPTKHFNKPKRIIVMCGVINVRHFRSM